VGYRHIILSCIIFIIYAPTLYCLEINLAPFMYYSSNKNQFEFSALGPIFEVTSSNIALRPLFYRDKTHIDILYPLGKCTDSRSRFSPVFRYERADEHMCFDLLLFFYGRDETKRYGGVFPLYGHLKNRFGFDEAGFVLWPLYSKSTTDDVNTYTLLWPIFTYSKGYKFKVFPVYGQEKQKDEMTQYLLWPIFHHKKSSSSQMDAILPLFFYDRGNSYKNMSILWPFFTYNKDYAYPHTSMDCPWPIIRFASGGYEEVRIFPLYWEKKGPGYNMKSIMWPVYRKEYSADIDLGRSIEKNQILILSGTTHETQRDGDKIDTLSIWPLFYSYKDTTHHSWHMPNIIPFNDDGFKLNWEPLLTLASASKTYNASTLDILWHTIYYTKAGPTYRTSFSFILSYEKAATYRQLGLLFNLLQFKWERQE